MELIHLSLPHKLNKHVKNIDTFTNIMEPNEIIDSEDHNSELE